MITGLLLAAGRGRRLGGKKQLAPWPIGNGQTKPLVAAAFDAVRPACDKMVVVLGHEFEQVRSALAPREFVTVRSDPDGQMWDSILAGLQVVDGAARVLLQPADHPTVQRSTLELLIAESKRWPQQAIIPAYQSKGGHPIVIPSTIVSELGSAAVEGGLSSFWKMFPHHRLYVDVDDPGILCGINSSTELRNAIDQKPA